MGEPREAHEQGPTDEFPLLSIRATFKTEGSEIPFMPDVWPCPFIAPHPPPFFSGRLRH